MKFVNSSRAEAVDGGLRDPRRGLLSFQSMESNPHRRIVTSRIIRPGQIAPVDRGWEGSTPAERISAVWDLTLLCLAWTGDPANEPRLQRSVSRVQRPRR